MRATKLAIVLGVLTLFSNEALADDHNFELGASVGPSYIISEGWATSMHGHAVWYIPHSPVGLGVGYERLFDDHSHNTVSLVSQFNIWRGWNVVLAPGLSFNDESMSASLHVETFYEFELNEHFHMGPAFEIAFGSHDTHLTPGVHMGVGF